LFEETTWDQCYDFEKKFPQKIWRENWSYFPQKPAEKLIISSVFKKKGANFFRQTFEQKRDARENFQLPKFQTNLRSLVSRAKL
jgi:hypothetical protein